METINEINRALNAENKNTIEGLVNESVKAIKAQTIDFTELKEAFKTANKWHFIGIKTDKLNVKLKFFIGKTETDVQIFTINDLHCNIGFNYGRKTATLKAIINKIEAFTG